jgi:hypothetical protein
VKDHFAELAEQVANEIPEALGCVVVSFDGAPLAAHPAHVLDLLKPLSVKLSRLSGIRRAFLEFGGSSLFSLSRTTYAVVIVTAQSVEHEAVLGTFEQVLDRVEKSETTPTQTPEFVGATTTEADAPGVLSDGSDEYAAENTVGIAQEFSSLLAETFGAGADEADETSEAEAAS